MPKRIPRWVFPAAGFSLLVNICMLLLVPLLSSEWKPPQDIESLGGISLVSLKAPEAPLEEEVKKPEEPKPEPESDFVPDLVRPGPIAPDAFDVGVAINLGTMKGAGMGGDFVFEAFELDEPPQVIVQVPPVYPFKAREQGIEGAVQVKLLINADGSVGQVQLLAAQPEGLFEESVLKAVPQWKFKPGKIEGKTVVAWVVTTIRFKL